MAKYFYLCNLIFTTMHLTESYFLQKNVQAIAHDLLGKYLFSIKEGQLAGGIITKVKACKDLVNNNLPSSDGVFIADNEFLWHDGGVACVTPANESEAILLIVSNVAGIPDAVLICAMQPTHGEELMLRRIGQTRVSSDLISSPAAVVKALGLSPADNGLSLTSSKLWIEDR